MIDGNIFENSWIGGQNGEAIVLTVRNQDGTAPWSTLEDITITNNIIKRVYNGFNFLGKDNPNPSQQARNFLIKNNLLTEIDPQIWCGAVPGCSTGHGRFVWNMARMENITFDHNTSIQTGDILHVDSVTPGFVYKNNLHPHNYYGIKGDGVNLPIDAFNTYFPNYIFLKNIIIGESNGNDLSSVYPNSTSNFFPKFFSDVGFVDYTNPNVSLRNYRLNSTSLYRNQGTDGKDVGVDFDELNVATCGVITGVPCVTQSQMPFPGPNMLDVPATIEVENFDRGGQGIAYNDTYGTTGSGAYRTNPVEAVDIQSRPNAASNGYAVFEASAGEWLEYTINVPVDRNYNIGFRYASEFNNGTFHLEDCGSDPQNQNPTCSNLTGTMTANSTDNWNNFRVLTKRNVQLSEGTHVLRLKMDTNSPDGCNCVVANFDAIRFTPTLFDFDNDGRADLSLFRPSDGNWYLDQSTSGFTAVYFGTSTDIITPADFDGDGKTDVAVFRPSNGYWYIFKSSTGTTTSIGFGTNGDIPVQADYDGDGKGDVAVFRPSDSTWYGIRSSDDTFFGGQFGQSGDKPAVGDYDADGKSDLAVFRPSDGGWYILNSSSGNPSSFSFGRATDKITPADYDGDGKTDLAVYRPSVGIWYLQRSLLGLTSVQFGNEDDIPAPADYDGDGKVDIGVFRPSDGTWHLSKSTEGIMSQAFGQTGDVPIPSTYVR